MAEIRHLYFHIPFCPKLCPYCSFYVEVGSKHRTTQFLDTLLRHIELAQKDWRLQPETIYFGGGTPSALTAAQLEYLFEGLRERLDLRGLKEFTIEANPATIQKEKARVLLAGGITRISLGVQSWNDPILKTLGRVHNAHQAEKTFHLLRDAGFGNVNIDLMFAVPGQTAEQWQSTLEKTIRLQPEHVSSYCLTYEEDTDFFHKLQGGFFTQSEDRDATLFETTMSVLSDAGFLQYEISNYARHGFESRHNRAYWFGADYLGFGPSAFSTVGLNRWQNVADTTEYNRLIGEGNDPAGFREALSNATRRGEIAAFALRTVDGVSLEDLAEWPNEVREFEELGFLRRSGSRMILTQRGKLMADSVAEAFV